LMSRAGMGVLRDVCTEHGRASRPVAVAFCGRFVLASVCILASFRAYGFCAALCFTVALLRAARMCVCVCARFTVCTCVCTCIDTLSEIHAGGVVWVAYSARGTYAATASMDGTAAVLHADSLAVAARLVGHEGGVRAVSFSPDGGWLCGGTVAASGSACGSDGATVGTSGSAVCARHPAVLLPSCWVTHPHACVCAHACERPRIFASPRGTASP
jgi:hypothetical protein